MNNFTIEEIRIGDKIIDKITDEEGMNWYPLKTFLFSILCKSDKVSSFRDSAIARYMQVIEYQTERPGMKRPIKTWCINELGIKYLLRHMKVNRTQNKALYKAREKGFYEACLYFKVKTPDELDPLYINTPPKITDYDIWSVTCLENDFKLKSNDRWKRCSECGYYYPDKTRYFGNDTRKKAKCLQCQGKDFKCRNKVIQFIYENDGLDLLYKLSLNKNDDTVEALKVFINKGGKNNEN